MAESEQIVQRSDLSSKTWQKALYVHALWKINWDDNILYPVMIFFTVQICNQRLIGVIYAKWSLNSEELMYLNKMYQCQSCNNFFDNEERFEKYIIQVHSEKNQSSDFNSNLPATNKKWVDITDTEK